MMATNLAKLRPSKGTPPVAEIAVDVIAANGREDDASMKPIQFRVPESVFSQFSEQAGREFGFSKGSKSQLFLKMWKAYQNDIRES